MGKSFEDLLESTHSEAGRNLKKVVSSKGKLQGNLYFAGDGKKVAGVVITLSARDPKGQKALTGGKALRKEIKGAKFSRGTIVMDGGKLVVELFAGTATAAMLKKAFKDDTFRKDAALKLLARSVIRKKGAGDDEDEVEAGEELSAEDLKVAEGAFSFGELTWLKFQQGSIESANRELAESFLSAESAEEERQEQILDTMQGLTDLNTALNEAVDAGDREQSLALQTLIDETETRLAELQSVGSDPFSGGVVDPSVKALMARVSQVPLEREALDRAHKETQSKRASGALKQLFSGLLGGGSGGDSTREGIRGRAEDVVWDAEQRERFEKIRLEMDMGLDPVVKKSTEFESLAKDGKTDEARKVGQSIISSINELIERAKRELKKVRADLQH